MGAAFPRPCWRCIVTESWPLELIGPAIPFAAGVVITAALARPLGLTAAPAATAAAAATPPPSAPAFTVILATRFVLPPARGAICRLVVAPRGKIVVEPPRGPVLADRGRLASAIPEGLAILGGSRRGCRRTGRAGSDFAPPGDSEFGGQVVPGAARGGGGLGA